jgi:hypothetical protein
MSYTNLLQAPRHSATQLQAAVDLLGLARYSWNPQTNELKWDRRIKATWAVPPDIEPDYDIWLNGIHPDDVDRVLAAVARCKDPRGDGVYDIAYRVIGLDGVERWVLTRGETLFKDGQPIDFAGVLLDLTPKIKQLSGSIMTPTDDPVGRELLTELELLMQGYPAGIRLTPLTVALDHCLEELSQECRAPGEPATDAEQHSWFKKNQATGWKLRCVINPKGRPSQSTGATICPARVLPLERIAEACRDLLQESARMLRHQFGNLFTILFLRRMVVLLADLVREAAEYERLHPSAERHADEDVGRLLEEFHELLRQMEGHDGHACKGGH